MNESEKREKKYAAYAAGTSSNDSRFLRDVCIIHGDGSYLIFKSAFLFKDGDWVVAVTEHHGIHIYHREDLESCFQAKNIKTPLQKKTRHIKIESLDD